MGAGCPGGVWGAVRGLAVGVVERPGVSRGALGCPGERQWGVGAVNGTRFWFHFGTIFGIIFVKFPFQLWASFLDRFVEASASILEVNLLYCWGCVLFIFGLGKNWSTPRKYRK